MKRRLNRLILLTVTCLLGFTSCTPVLLGLFGMKSSKSVDEKMIIRYSDKYNIPLTDSYELDTSYISYLYSFDTAKYNSQIKNHYQPLQALYYDNSGYLKSFQVNCYAGGFPNLKWERNEIMTEFPPKQQAPLDSLVQFETQLKYLNPLSQTESFYENSYDYFVIVYWSRFMGRQSKRLIRIVQENSMLAPDKNIKIIYANTDNIFAED